MWESVEVAGGGWSVESEEWSVFSTFCIFDFSDFFRLFFDFFPDFFPISIRFLFALFKIFFDFIHFFGDRL